MHSSPIKILTVSGSLRENSSTQIVLNFLEKSTAANVVVTQYKGIADLPHFNDSNEVPSTVEAWRRQLTEADGVLICTPEYAFGVPGSLKNALDWTVGSCEFVNKPVAVITAATGGDKAHASLLLTLSALSSKVSDEAALLIPFIRSKIDKEGNIKDSETERALLAVWNALIKSIVNL
ncbi:NADPH-dependent FMN reductase [Ohtaekwangia koreensis]|uniref:NAD(P)H-dependent FMN reductase n=1 Tax=Ohtaekwangia koreensis TaxID=688867 RepID=A0A1T5LD14_9BACT|nr:NADPH-dependent FMN reductase [Ohtaekwangia koreensis]SKC73882.1 NAD(P)H-dependent FMN reductase [Ohtaekwangia koreensis]